MTVSERFSDLPDYAFQRLRALLAPHAPGGAPIQMSVGEPRHPFPDFVGPILAEHLGGFNGYPPNEGSRGLLAACAGWLGRRYGVAVDPATQVMVLNGSREGLFNACLALCPASKNGTQAAVLMPNPFYQVYAAAALAAGAEPRYVPATEATSFLPDYAGLPGDLLDRTAAVYVCSPANPQGAVADGAWWRDLLALAERHDFQIFSDECYSEIWYDTPPPGVLAAAAAVGADPERAFVFQSLSKRSNLAGLRSGFVAGGPEGIAAMKVLRSYAGAPVPMPLQAVSEAAWNDEAHVEANRAAYAAKRTLAGDVLGGVQGYRAPEAGFFLWLPVDDGEAATLRLWRETGVRVLPGAYLSREVGGVVPGQGYVRAAIVGPEPELEAGLGALRACLYG